MLKNFTKAVLATAFIALCGVTPAQGQRHSTSEIANFPTPQYSSVIVGDCSSEEQIADTTAAAEASPEPIAPVIGPVALKKLKLGVSIYTGWMPWYLADAEGIVKAWGTAKGYDIEVVKCPDYNSSITAYVTGQVDALVVTNMDALIALAAAGQDTTAIIMGDYSNGNDAIVVYGFDEAVKKNPELAAKPMQFLKGKEVAIITNTVTHYLGARGCQQSGMKLSDITWQHVDSESDINSAFSGKQIKACGTWNPVVMQLLQLPGAKDIFNSSKIPGEIQDLCVVRTAVAKSDPGFCEALTGSWYEVLAKVQQRGEGSKKAKEEMAKFSGCNLAEFEAQLTTTAMFWTAQSALDFTKSTENQEKNDLVRRFCFEQGLLGADATTVDWIGISYPDGKIQGNPKNVKLRYDARFMELAATGKLTK